MLVLSRRLDESIVIDGGIRVTVLRIQGREIRLGVEAPRDVRIMRAELDEDSRKFGGRLAETSVL